MLKPMVAAVIGGAYGGGVEMLLNCDIVVASEEAKFALPEVKRGVVAVQGGKLQSISSHVPTSRANARANGFFTCRHSKISTHRWASGTPSDPYLSIFISAMHRVCVQ